nr:hypothetical protein [Tanacetum cinerariifolium]
MSFGYRLNPRFAIKECSSCGALYTRDCSCSKGSVEDKVLVPKLPENYASDVLAQGVEVFLAKDFVIFVEIIRILQMILQKQEEKRIEEEQAANARYWKIPACCDDDDDYDSVITPVSSTEEPVNSLSMGDEHLDTIPATESDEVIKFSVEDLVPIPSESEVENGCDVPSCFTTFSNILFDADYDFESVDDQSLHNEDVSEKIFSNPLFEEEIISIRIDQHHFNAESDLVESMLNRN